VNNKEGNGKPMLRKLFSQKTAEWGTTALVLASAGLAGHQAALGMTQAQFMGAATAILGSVMAAVMVRIWPMPEKAPVRVRKDD